MIDAAALRQHLTDAFEGGEDCAHDGLGQILHFLQPLAFLCVGIAVPGHYAKQVVNWNATCLSSSEFQTPPSKLGEESFS